MKVLLLVILLMLASCGKDNVRVSGDERCVEVQGKTLVCAAGDDQ